MGFPRYDLVERAYQELKAEGYIKELPVGQQEEVENQKGILTRRAAYYSYLADNKYGILEKTSGNNSEGYSVDIIIDKETGDIYDVATDNGRIAIPVNGGPENHPDLIPRWRTPTAKLAGIGSEPVPEPGPEPEPEPPPDETNAKLDLLIEENRAMRSIIDLILARQDNHDQQFNNMRLEIRDVREKQNQPYSYKNRIIGGITPVGV